MIKYITNNNRYMKHANRTIFFLSKVVADVVVKEDGYVKLYMSGDGNYIKVKGCSASDVNGSRVHTANGASFFSACELLTYIDSSDKIYAYGTDTHGGVILRLHETQSKPKNFKVLKKEPKMFMANSGFDAN